MKQRTALFIILTVLLLFSCSPDMEIVLTTTTSTENSGLLAAILPEFEKESGYRVNVIAVGTGKAIRLAKEGNADLIMVHAREREEQFVADGYGLERIGFMHNDFIILGPDSDPAGIIGAADLKGVFSLIKESDSPFISRADDSGTHIKEMSLWANSGVVPIFSNYIEAGAGMNAVLNIAHEKQAYTLADRGTFLSALNRLDLSVLFEGADELMNPYGVIAVSPDKHAHVNAKGAASLIRFLTSPKGQKMIGDFTINGKQLFIPDMISLEQ